jgi:alanine racemase
VADPNIWAEIDLGAIAHNVRELRRVTRPEALLMAVVKGDGYGHGAVAVARTALANGAAMLAVARLEEGVALRQAGFEAPILVFGRPFADQAADLIRHHLIQSVVDLEDAEMLSGAARARGAAVAVHLKVDSGMGRLGLVPDPRSAGAIPSAVARAAALAKLPGVRLEGVFTHFAAADSAEKTSARRQFEVFTAFLEALERAGIEAGLRHAANSAAVIDLPHTHLDAVRPGIALYGLYPSPEVDTTRVDLRPALSLKARVLQVKPLPAGAPVSYGMTWKAPRDTVIATVPAGYADGISRRLSNLGRMLVRGRSAPIAGRICMDLTMLDVGAIAGVAPGDEVVIIGRQGDQVISADEMAGLLETISYEVVFTNSLRVPKVYID